MCEYPGCDKTFGDSSSLARHRRTHTGKRPYKCEDPVCDKTFTRRTTLTAHMRTHDPTWEPDPNVYVCLFSLRAACRVLTRNGCACRKYSFKAKKAKLDTQAELTLEEARAVTALLQAHPDSGGGEGSAGGGGTMHPPLEEHLVATISAEIAAALAKAHARIYEDEEDGEDEESGSEDGADPNISGVRGEDGEERRRGGELAGPTAALLGGDGEEEEEFPVPLRPRRGKEPAGVAGMKRKR